MDSTGRSIEISDEEGGRTGTLSAENRKLGAMLLHGRGYVLLKQAVPEELITELRTAFRDIFIDCKASMGDESRGSSRRRGDKDHLLATQFALSGSSRG